MSKKKKISNILIVDDDPVLVRMLEGRLCENGFEILKATEAADGLQIAMDQNPDLIILDVMMPIINGYNFCRLLKSEEKQKDIPIVMLTSRDAVEDIQIGLEMGADAYLTKPVNMQKLIETINMMESKLE